LLQVSKCDRTNLIGPDIVTISPCSRTGRPYNYRTIDFGNDQEKVILDDSTKSTHGPPVYKTIVFGNDQGKVIIDDSTKSTVRTGRPYVRLVFGNDQGNFNAINIFKVMDQGHGSDSR
jgi:hypothetical protein